MSAIEASSVGVKTMADGTLRLSVDIEPRFARDAFALFGSPGTPMALAAMQVQREPEQQKEELPKGGEHSQWLAMRCGEPEFQHWLSKRFPARWEHATAFSDSERAAKVCRWVCGVTSRAVIDHDDEARQKFMQQIKGPWQRHWLQGAA